MGYRHSADDILDAAVACVHDDGLHQLTFGRVAKRLGINDRTIVYYFPSKADLITAVLARIGEHLQAVLAAAFQGPVADHRELLDQAWPVLAHPDADPTFAVFFQTVGLATTGQEPYAAVLDQVMQAWRAWLCEFFAGTDEERTAEAESAMAVLDGLLLLRQTVGADAAERAAARIGITHP
ncbi:MAG: TetR/AcrR family transcriptional regulator [Actinomycetota bacterium]